MALTISKGLDPEIMRLLLGLPSKSMRPLSLGQNISATRTLSFGDSFLSSSSDAVLMFAVQKLQAAVNRPV